MCIWTNIVGMYVAQLLGLWLTYNRIEYVRNQQKLLLFHQLSIRQYGLQFLEVYIEQGCIISICYNFHVTGYRCCGHSNLLGHLYGCYLQWTNNCILPIHINIILFCSIAKQPKYRAWKNNKHVNNI